MAYIPLIIFIISSLIICIFDIKSLHLPLLVLYVSFITSSVFFILNDFEDFLLRMASAASLFALFFFCRLITRGKLGWGDIQYSAFCALLTGLPLAFAAVLASCLLAALFFLIAKFIKRPILQSKKMIPFTPFMFVGSIFMLFLL